MEHYYSLDAYLSTESSDDERDASKVQHTISIAPPHAPPGALLASTKPGQQHPVRGDGFHVTRVQPSLCDDCLYSVRKFLETGLDTYKELGKPLRQSRPFGRGKGGHRWKSQSRSVEDITEAATSGCWTCAHVVASDACSKTLCQDAYLRAGGYRRLHFVKGLATAEGKEAVGSISFIVTNVDVAPKAQGPVADGETYTWSARVCDMVKEYLDECDGEHAECIEAASTTGDPSRPHRFLDLGGPGSDTVKLVKSRHMAFDERYAVLSHCWGGQASCKLTNSTLADYTRNIPLQQMPQTFVDAFTVCRDLGLRYLWLDTLCIIQDSSYDWEREAPKMAAIFANAYVTLAAAAARGDSEGFIRQLDPMLRSPLRIDISTASGENISFSLYCEDHFRAFVENSRLFSRTWIFQERALSRRTLYFCNNQIFWQCLTKTQAVHENSSFQDPQSGGLSSTDLIRAAYMGHAEVHQIMKSNHGWTGTESQLAQQLKTSDRARAVSNYYYRNKWYKLVQSYVRLDLTRPTDKLIAISGLAQNSSSAGWNPYEYIAGHWQHSLPQSLLWYTKIRAPRTPNDAPSWSWASVHSIAVNTIQSNLDTEKLLAVVLGHNTRGSRATTSFGSSGHIGLSLKCRLCKVDMAPSAFDSTKAKHTFTFTRRLSNKLRPLLQVRNVAYIDHAPSARCANLEAPLFFMPIEGSNAGDGSSRSEIAGLLVQPKGISGGEFVRIGYALSMISIPSREDAPRAEDRQDLHLVLQAVRSLSRAEGHGYRDCRNGEYEIDLV